MSTKIQARVSHRFEAPAERVFDAWLDPAFVRVWMRAALLEMGLPGAITEVAVDARPGGGFTFADERAEGEARHRGTYLALERPSKLSFTWITDASEEADPSVVTLTIRPESRGCVVDLVHEMSADWRDYVRRTERGWSLMLAAIEARLDGRSA